MKPFDNFDFVCRVLFSHVFLLLLVEQGPPFSVTFCIAVMLSSKLRNSGCRCAWVPSEFSSSSSLILDLTGFDLTNERIDDCWTLFRELFSEFSSILHWLLFKALIFVQKKFEYEVALCSFLLKWSNGCRCHGFKTNIFETVLFLRFLLWICVRSAVKWLIHKIISLFLSVLRILWVLWPLYRKNHIKLIGVF